MFPINLRLAGRKVLVVGGGRVGQRKLDKIIRAGATALVVEPEPVEKLKNLAAQGAIELTPQFNLSHLDGVSLVFAATASAEINLAVAQAAQARGLWVNVADSPEQSDFFLPAVVEEGDFLLAISTGGASPALSARVAQDLREKFGPVYGQLASLAARLRPILQEAISDQAARESIFRQVIDSQALRSHLETGDLEGAVKILREIIAPVKLEDNFYLKG